MACSELFRRVSLPALPALFIFFLCVGVTHVVADECGTKFTDPSSSTVLAEIVVQGSVDSMRPSLHISGIHSANVTIAKVYKGMNVLNEMGISVDGNVTVDRFGPETDPNECVAAMSDVKAENGHLFFLRSTPSHGVLEMTALPLPAELSLKQTVEESLCDTCVNPPEIQRVMCRQCARPPVFKNSEAKYTTVRLGQKARLGCYARGKPSPQFSWEKSGLPITSGSGGIIIKSSKTSSVLIIKKTTTVHKGQYLCKIENELGDATKLLHLEFRTGDAPTPKPKKYNVRNAPDRRVCDRAVCLNGGTCFYSPSLDLSFCKCTKGFEGVKCENDISGSSNTLVPSTSRNVSDAGDNETHVCTTQAIRCLNGGTCLYLRSDERMMCKCPEGFVGERCERTSNVSTESPVTSREHFDASTNSISIHQTTAIIPKTTPSPVQNETDMLQTKLDFVTRPQDLSSTSTATPEKDNEIMETKKTTVSSLSTTEIRTTQASEENSSVSRNNRVSRRFHANVDDEALKLILSLIADNDLPTNDCSPSFHDFCENGGTCRYVNSFNVAICLCPKEFSGNRCQVHDPQKIDSQDINSRTPQTKDDVWDSPDKVLCATNNRNNCLNGGTCYYSVSLASILCKCVEGFKGARCENNLSDPEAGQDDSLSIGQHQHETKDSAGDKSSGQAYQKPKGRKHKSTGTSSADGNDQALAETISRLRNGRIKAGRCKSKGFCLNKGKCRFIHKLRAQVCLCRPGYTGRRCEHSETK